MIRTARDWLLRRFLQFVLRRALGKYLRAGDLDLDQVEVKLDAGYLEIKSVLIDCDVLNKDLVRIDVRLPHAWDGCCMALSMVGLFCMMMKSIGEGRPNWWLMRCLYCLFVSSEYPGLGGESPARRER